MKPAMLMALGAACLCAQPHLQNAKLENRAVSGSLDATFRAIVSAQTSPAWIAYATPQIPGDRTMCCFNTINGVSFQGCGLEPNQANITVGPNGAKVYLEGAPEFYVFYRVEDRQVGKIRDFSLDCNIDAAGLPVYFLTGVNPAQSVALLESLVPSSSSNSGDRRISNSAISAIGMTRDPAADAALDRLAAASRPEEVRRQAVMMLGASRGGHGFDALQRILKEDPSERVRENAVTALAQNKDTQVASVLAKVAHDDSSARVRGQAIFWLAQTASRQISEAAIRDAIDKDPEAQVKRKAVQALAEMKDGAGVPILIDIARNNPNLVVRKEAMRELGQSRDPRAAAFFEDVLTKH
ncbi:MAG TPA: HEAT repeat domain-containing protein [Bryobacteraceae bacterium]|nr:HEAT repeat domain-containing protein [Bryobacteraceae bacterium]